MRLEEKKWGYCLVHWSVDIFNKRFSSMDWYCSCCWCLVEFSKWLQLASDLRSQFYGKQTHQSDYNILQSYMYLLVFTVFIDEFILYSKTFEHRLDLELWQDEDVPVNDHTDSCQHRSSSKFVPNSLTQLTFKVEQELLPQFLILGGR